MDRRRRLSILAEAATPDRERGLPSRLVGTTAVRMPGGGRTAIMRIMQTNACSLSCGYCPLFSGGRFRRVALSADEVASTFMEAHRKGLADGLFLTSGVPGRAHRAVDRMLAAVEILRRREAFRGYVHVKLLPGVETAQVEAAVGLADRVSINLEAPGDAYVRSLASEKDFGGDLLPKLELAGRLSLEARLAGAGRRARDRPSAGTTTQFVVGGSGERDHEILGLVAGLERRRLLHHAHFSAFQPVAGTPMEGRPPTPYMRELRLYQAEHLLRQYGFRFDELIFGSDGNLPLDHDPKTAWAARHPERFPLDVADAPYEALVRVPGIGSRAAWTLVGARRGAAIRGLGDLRRLGVDTLRAGHFLALRGRRLATSPPPEQLRLFAHDAWFKDAAWKTTIPPCAFR